MIGWGTVADIALYVARPARTIRNWAAQGTIPSQKHPETGQILVHAASARQHADTRERRKRLTSKVP